MRIVLAERERKVRSALRLLIEHQPGMSVVGEATGAEDLLAQTGSLCPDLVVLDTDLPGLPTVELLGRLHHLCASLPIVALSLHPEMHLDMLAAGASLFVAKIDPPDVLISALRALSIDLDNRARPGASAAEPFRD